MMQINDCCIKFDETVIVSDVKKVFNNLKTGKSCGLDNLNSEHFIHASKKLFVLLTLVFIARLTHGFLSKTVMGSVNILVVVTN